MILVTHIIIALTSIVFTFYTVCVPNSDKLRTSGILTALTIASGTVLVVSTSSPLLQSCMTGLAYLAVMFAAMALSYYRLARASQ
jgi:hypothetical protein